MGAEYTERSYLNVDDVCPYEYTVKGLANNVTYYFAVRAEDSTVGVETHSPVAEGREAVLKR